MITLRLKRPLTVPIEAETLRPDRMVDLPHDDLRRLPVWLGRRQCRLDELFDIEGERSDHLAIVGDTARVKRIGEGMTSGKISVRGDAGMHLGAFMTGGEIEVSGNAMDWLGAEMRGGLIRVAGDAGGQVGAAYRGGPAGMRGGTICIGGTAGREVGLKMKRGTIIVQGPVGEFAGLQMKGGTLVLGGGAGPRAGAWMIRGTILSLVDLPLLPTFSYACSDQPTFLRIYARELQLLGMMLPVDPRRGLWDRYTGDSSVPGKGEILVWRSTGSDTRSSHSVSPTTPRRDALQPVP